MIFGNRFARMIFFASISVILVLNMWFWIAPQTTLVLTNNDPDIANEIYNFKGFYWFSQRISEFPGVRDLIEDITWWIQNAGVREIPILDDILAIIKLFITPLVLIGFLLKNVIVNLIWVFKFLGLGIFGAS